MKKICREDIYNKDKIISDVPCQISKMRADFFYGVYDTYICVVCGHTHGICSVIYVKNKSKFKIILFHKMLSLKNIKNRFSCTILYATLELFSLIHRLYVFPV